MDSIDKEIEKDQSTLNFFRTNFGQEFEENYDDLLVFSGVVSILPGLMNTVEFFLRGLFQGDIFAKAEKMITEDTTKSLEEKNNEIKLIDEQKKYFQSLFSARKHENELLPDKSLDTDAVDKTDQNQAITNEEQVQAATQEDMSKVFDGWQKLKLLQRITAYFTLTLYAYIDVYSVSLFQHVVARIEPEELYDYLLDFNVKKNPEKQINHVLKKIGLSQALGTLLADCSWKIYKKELRALIDIRNIIAHRKPMTDIAEIREKFPKSSLSSITLLFC
jgi:hypothetical protein